VITQTVAVDTDLRVPDYRRDRQMPYLLLVTAAILTAMGVAKLGGASRPSNVPWAPLLLWALLLGIGISVWLSSARIG